MIDNSPDLYNTFYRCCSHRSAVHPDYKRQHYDTRFAEFETAVRNETEIDTFFFVTDFEGAYKEMAAAFPGKESHQLYREYIENFVIGARRI